MEKQQEIMACWPYQASFLVTSFTQAPGRQQTSMKMVCPACTQHVRCSVLCREESPATKTHLFFFEEVNLILREGYSDFGFHASCSVNGLLSPTDGHSTSRAWYLLCWGTYNVVRRWGGSRVARKCFVATQSVKKSGLSSMSC